MGATCVCASVEAQRQCINPFHTHGSTGGLFERANDHQRGAWDDIHADSISEPLRRRLRSQGIFQAGRENVHSGAPSAGLPA
jgi:hypothetical protein